MEARQGINIQSTSALEEALYLDPASIDKEKEKEPEKEEEMQVAMNAEKDKEWQNMKDKEWQNVLLLDELDVRWAQDSLRRLLSNQARIYIPEGYNLEKIMMMVLNDGYYRDERFEIFDYLLERGVALPKPELKRENFTSCFAYFQALLKNDIQLYFSLRADNNLATEQDENGDTLLHLYYKRDGEVSPSCYAILRKTLDLTINIKNKDGNTPVHLCALTGGGRFCGNFTERFLTHTLKLRFNFFIKNNNGQSVLDIARENKIHYGLDKIEKHYNEKKRKKLTPIFTAREIDLEANPIDSELISVMMDMAKSTIANIYLERKGSHHTIIQKSVSLFSIFTAGLADDVGDKRAKFYLELMNDARHTSDLHQLIILQALLAQPYGSTLKSDIVKEFMKYGGAAFDASKLNKELSEKLTEELTGMFAKRLTRIIGRVINLVANRENVSIPHIKQLIRHVVEAVETAITSNELKVDLSFAENVDKVGLPKLLRGGTKNNGQ